MKTLQQLQSELDQVLAWFESGDADIDQAEAKYKQGLEVAAELKKRLAETENSIQKLRVKFDEADSV